MIINDGKIIWRCLITFSESEYVEPKSEVVGDLCKEIIAFVNTKGGTIYIGVQDDGNIVMYRQKSLFFLYSRHIYLGCTGYTS